jgi:hypothetical protein
MRGDETCVQGNRDTVERSKRTYMLWTITSVLNSGMGDVGSRIMYIDLYV